MAVVVVVDEDGHEVSLRVLPDGMKYLLLSCGSSLA